MKNENTVALNRPVQLLMLDQNIEEIQERSDRWADYILFMYFFAGLFFATFYNTWSVAIGVGSLSVLAYGIAKFGLPNTKLNQYVFSTVLAVFMAQYIYQMHGMFEMHFTAFIGSAILIMYQNWRLQIPLVVVVVGHHAVFGYLQYTGQTKYFTQLQNMDLMTYFIHVALAAIIFIICGTWAYYIKVYNDNQLQQALEMADLYTEAEAQKEAAIKANSELDKFVYSVSHDLRAPLLSLQGMIEITEAETCEPLTREHMKMMRGGISVLDNFIAEILDYSRNIRKDVKNEYVDLKKLIEEITSNLLYMNGANNKIDVRADVYAYDLFYSDKGRLTVILNNLISNSIRYYDQKSSDPYVKISVTVDKEQARIIVLDNGIGISEEYHQKVFDMFYRVSEKSTGSGLGLFIVKETVEKLTGSITLDSKPGLGTKVVITIPNLAS
ncbi:sensor histidine kinase [Solitalea lacus]|uniref:sensor histidine kinase n=1 Tax=Solitalea lacus TaxID=2911172 RepID=UPI001ED9E8FC|nr:HAMP domain-containing sensor histidine kinase [Solitalea lacus]UKJ07898.1 HAMP domain-containing histidine kinase [Solitalea lacus]